MALFNDITTRLSGKREGGSYRCCCPVCGNHNLIVTKDKKILANCKNGCSQNDVINALQDRGLWTKTQYKGVLKANSSIALINEIWSKSLPANDERSSILKQYLSNRGLKPEPIPEAIRFTDCLEYYGDGFKSKYPALVAKISDIKGEMIGLQRIYLNSEGTKADVRNPKKTLGKVSGGAVRLAEATHEFGLAEGIETALAVQQAIKIPVWATLSASNLTAIKIPQSVTTVHIFADKDRNETGQKAARDLAQKLIAKSKTVFVHVPSSPIKEGAKSIDWLDILVNEGPLAIKKSLDETKPFSELATLATLADPIPLKRKLPSSTQFPIEALGKQLAPVAKRLHEVIQAPQAICAQSILAAATLAVQAYADIYIDGRQFPVSCFFVTVGESGERKSAVDKIALKPHKIYEVDLQKRYYQELKQFKDNSFAFEKAKQEAVKRAKTYEEKKHAIAKLGNEPQPPIEPLIIIEEPTYEGLVKLLINGRPSIGLFTDEGARFLSGYSMNSENQLKTAAGFCGFWDNGSTNRIRAGEGNSVINGRRVSTHWMFQPNVSELLLGNSQLKGQGLLSRCLTVFPESTVGTRSYKAVNLEEDPVITQYEKLISAILRRTPLLEENTRNQLKPRKLTLNAEAKNRWVAFYNDIEKLLYQDSEVSNIKGFANKIPEHTLRIAGVLTLIYDLDVPYINEEHITSAIELGHFYLKEALRLFQSSQDNPDLLLAEKLIHWLHSERFEYVSLPDIYQLGPNAIRDSKTAKHIVSILVDHGWLVALDGGKIIEGKRRKDVWKVVNTEN